jgi:putative copper export protein
MLVIEAAASATTYGTLALLIGALVMVSFLLPRGEPSFLRQQLFSFAVKLLPLFIAASLVSLTIQGTKLNSGALPNFELLTRYLFNTQSGKIWAARLVYAMLLLTGMLWYRQKRNDLVGLRVWFVLSLPLLVSRSLTSHAVAVRESTQLAVAADALHLLATAVWAGGLPILSWVIYRGTGRMHLAPSWTAATVVRFSWLALIAVALLVTTGVYQSWIEVQRLDILFATPYGQVLTLKLLFFICMSAFGAVNLLSTKPKLLQSGRANRLPNWLQKKTLRRISSEAILGLMVFCVTGFLTLFPPGIHSLHQSSASEGRGLQAYPERLNILTWLGYVLSPTPKLQPAQGAKVAILVPRAGEVFHSDEVPLRYDFTPGKVGNHVHAYVDGELMGMFSDPSNGTLTGIKPGKHVLELRVTTADHVTELEATDKVNFTVE